MSDDIRDLWGSFEGILKACNKVCEYKKNRKCNVNMWRWNSGLMDEIQKKEAYKEMKKIPLKKPKMNAGDRRKLPRKQLLEL